MEREVDEMQMYSNFPRPATPVPQSSANVHSTFYSLPRFLVTSGRIVISGFVGLSAVRSVGERDSVDPENWPGLWITRNYPAWSYLAYYRLVFKTIGL